MTAHGVYLLKEKVAPSGRSVDGELVADRRLVAVPIAVPVHALGGREEDDQTPPQQDPPQVTAHGVASPPVSDNR